MIIENKEINNTDNNLALNDEELDQVSGGSFEDISQDIKVSYAGNGLSRNNTVNWTNIKNPKKG
ncbi:MAG: hypothetical protein K6F99_02020 [Lachnospiraceae bacterium]|nr:hypothetical protein [Lachnospiraceae bacterium]